MSTDTSGRNEANQEPVALITVERSYGYAEMEAASDRLAGALRVHLGTPLGGRRIAFTARADVSSYVMILAALREGFVLVPLHPRLTPTEREALCGRILGLVEVDPARLLDAALPAPARPNSLPAFDEAPLAILFTSGTTGTPKAALLSRRAFAASAAASAAFFGWQPDDRWLLCMPLAHVGGISVVIRSYLARKTVVLYGEASFDPTRVVSFMRDTRVTRASLVPTMLTRILEKGLPCPASLRVALLGGAAASERLLRAGGAAGWPLYTTYGLTEACSHVTLERVDRDDACTMHAVGRPISGTEVKIDEGQILVRSATLFSGYLGPDDRILDALRPDGFFATGDLGELDAEGRLSLRARRSDLIVTGGENVYPREVEAVLESVPGVAGAVVFGVEDETWGQVVAMCVSLEDSSGSLAAVASAVRPLLAPHKRPRLGVIATPIPLTPVGKVDLRAVRALPLTRL
jgi:O-succinylbenzoic acid--CoA ligase